MSGSSSPHSMIPSLSVRLEERERLLRRLEHNARAREYTCAMKGAMAAKREELKENYQKQHRHFLQEMLDSKQERIQRWVQRTSANPFHQDLWSADQRIFIENQARDKLEARSRKLAEKRARDAHNAVLARALAERDDLGELRTERRELVTNEKLMKALKDVERSNSRAAKALQERKRLEFEKQQQQLARAMSSPAL